MPRSLQAMPISAPDASRQDQAPSPLSMGWVVRYGLTLAWVGAVTIICVIVDHLIQAPSLALAFVVPVVLAAVTFGWGPSLFAAVTGMLACDFFFITPRYSLWVADPGDIWTLCLLLIVGVIVSTLAARARERAVEAERSADQSRAVQDLAHVLVQTHAPQAVALAAAQALERILQAPAVVLVGRDGALSIAASAGDGRLSAADLEAATFAMTSGLPTRAQTYPADRASFDFWPVAAADSGSAVLGVNLSGRDTGRPGEADRFAEIVGAYLAVALDHPA